MTPHDATRLAFEEWTRAQKLDLPLLRNRLGLYVEFKTLAAWEAWQAALACSAASPSGQSARAERGEGGGKGAEDTAAWACRACCHAWFDATRPAQFQGTRPARHSKETGSEIDCFDHEVCGGSAEPFAPVVRIRLWEKGPDALCPAGSYGVDIIGGTPEWRRNVAALLRAPGPGVPRRAEDGGDGGGVGGA